MEILFILGGGLGNIIQATPSIKLLSEFHELDLFLNCDTSKDYDIFKIGKVRNIFSKHPNKIYNYQLKGPFTPKIDEKFGKIITSRINYAQHKPEAHVYYDMINQLGINEKMGQIEICFDKNEKYKDYVGVYPGCKQNWPMKKWDKYDLLCSKFEKVLLFGLEDDICNKNPTWIKKSFEWPNNVIHYKSSLKETASVISGLKFFVGNDGGLTQLAAATGVKTFVIFGPSSIVKNKPFSDNCYDISLGLECSPCQFRSENGQQIFGSNKCDCAFNIKCLREMSVDFVINKIYSNLS